MKVLFSCLFCLVLVSACSHPTKTYTTRVTSEPPGARIELNHDYLGVTPIDINWPGYTENDRFVADWAVQAIPAEPGQYVQEKRFKGTSPGYCWGDPIPKHIFFDMSISSTNKKDPSERQ